jgi:hypothetical protein
LDAGVKCTRTGEGPGIYIYVLWVSAELTT